MPCARRRSRSPSRASRAFDVHAGEGLVQQQHVRLLGERPGQEHALLLAAGELADGRRSSSAMPSSSRQRATTSRSAARGRRNQPSRP